MLNKVYVSMYVCMYHHSSALRKTRNTRDVLVLIRKTVLFGGSTFYENNSVKEITQCNLIVRVKGDQIKFHRGM